MSPSQSHPIHPDPVDALPDEFRIEGVLGVREVLRDLMMRKVPVSLYAETRTNDFLVTNLTHLDANELEFALELQDEAALDQAIRFVAKLSSITCVAFPGRVKTQFRLERFSIEGPESGRAPVLTAAIPSELWRIQRRDAFRVTPPPEDQARFVRRDAEAGDTGFQLADLSAGGAGLLVPAESPIPMVGDCWPHGRIETADGRVIPCTLVVRHVDEAAAGKPSHQVGCEFRHLPPEVQRLVQLYVLDIDKRLRRGA